MFESSKESTTTSIKQYEISESFTCHRTTTIRSTTCYENIQDVDYSEINKGRPQVPATYYNFTNINGGDYIVMTGKLHPQQGQKTASYIAQKLERTQNYDNLFQRSYDPNLCDKYLANSLHQENS